MVLLDERQLAHSLPSMLCGLMNTAFPFVFETDKLDYYAYSL